MAVVVSATNHRSPISPDFRKTLRGSVASEALALGPRLTRSLAFRFKGRGRYFLSVAELRLALDGAPDDAVLELSSWPPKPVRIVTVEEVGELLADLEGPSSTTRRSEVQLVAPTDAHEARCDGEPPPRNQRLG